MLPHQKSSSHSPSLAILGPSLAGARWLQVALGSGLWAVSDLGNIASRGVGVYCYGRESSRLSWALCNPKGP